jgi:hypothetical protein
LVGQREHRASEILITDGDTLKIEGTTYGIAGGGFFENHTRAKSLLTVESWMRDEQEKQHNSSQPHSYN